MAKKQTKDAFDELLEDFGKAAPKPEERSSRFSLAKIPGSRGFISIGVLAGILGPLSWVGSTSLQFNADSHLDFSYAEVNCISKPILFPGDDSIKTDGSFEAQIGSGPSIGGFKLYSGEVCLSPSQTPGPQETLNAHMLGFLTSSITVSSQRPLLQEDISESSNTTSPDAVLSYQLQQPDIYSSYILRSPLAASECDLENNQTIRCSLEEHGLDYSTSYSLELLSTIGQQETLITSQTIVTTSQLEITEVSLEEGSRLEGYFEGVDITLNREVTSASAQLVGDNLPEPIELGSAIDGSIISVAGNDQLDRDASYQILVSAESIDGTSFDQEVALGFDLLGAAEVIDTNITSYGYPLSQAISLRFDQDLLPGQSVPVTLSSSSGNVPFTTSISGNMLYISPTPSLQKCTDITIGLEAGTKNLIGYGEDNPYSSTFRTTCASQQTIGTSVEGRPITAYGYGSGSNVTLYYGGIHGNEQSSKIILDELRSQLEQDPSLIPTGTSVWIVPSASPDGITKNTRVNARGVDLNRNFDTQDWATDVGSPYGTIIGGGGNEPFSEPESTAIANFTQSIGADRVIYYHAVAKVVISTGGTTANQLTNTYSQMTGFPNRTGQSSDVFAYSITGTYGDWLFENTSAAGVLVELETQAGNEFAKHKQAMLAMMSY